MRNYALGAAAAALLILLAVYQVGVKELFDVEAWLFDFKGKTTLNWKLVGGSIALLGTAVALPAWITLASICESYIFAGESSYPHFGRGGIKGLLAILMLVAGISQLASVSGIFMYLLPTVFCVFAGSVAVAVVIYIGHYLVLQNWWQKNASGQGKQ